MNLTNINLEQQNKYYKVTFNDCFIKNHFIKNYIVEVDMLDLFIINDGQYRQLTEEVPLYYLLKFSKFEEVKKEDVKKYLDVLFY